MSGCIYIGKHLCCQGKPTYGSYCYKHRSEHLLKDGCILEEKFTALSKDYLTKDLRGYCQRYYHLVGDVRILSGKKGPLFSEVCSIIDYRKRYYADKGLAKIRCIQKWVRGYLERTRYLCHNTEDFFTYEILRDIPPWYYHKYRDTRGFAWGFDIRSLKKLIDMKYDNPYTTEPIPAEELRRIQEKLKICLERGHEIEFIYHTIPDTRTIKQCAVDLFSNMERLGYPCDISWFMDLGTPLLKELHRQLEDMWNYRLQLPRHVKCMISPPTGRIFTTPTSVLHRSSREYLQELLLREVSSFSRASLESNQKLGYMYFLMCLGYVSQPCNEAYAWLHL